MDSNETMALDRVYRRLYKLGKEAEQKTRQSGTKRCPICHSPARFEGGCWICDCNRKGTGQ